MRIYVIYVYLWYNALQFKIEFLNVLYFNLATMKPLLHLIKLKL